MNKFVLFILCGIFLFFCLRAVALPNFKLRHYSKHKVEVSKFGLNRINMMPYAISQIVGNGAKYEVKIDNDSKSFYIKPLCEIGETIELSIKTLNNNFFDIELKVVEGNGRTIYLCNSEIEEERDKIIGEEAKLMVNAMKKGEVGKYYVKDVEKYFPNELNLEIRQVKSYKYDNIHGAILLVRNQSSDTISLKERYFAELFENSVAVSFDFMNPTLPPLSGVVIRVFVVTSVH